MTRISVIATAAAAAVTMALALDVAAQQPDTRDRTFMTFSAPVELPGLRLDAGTYVFRLADTATRNVIQVLTEDEMKMLGQWLYVPAERQEVTGDTVVTFRETIANATPAVQFWYYPGERLGKEFIYPKDQAMQIAQRTGAGVLTEEGRVDAQGQVTAQAQAPAQSDQPSQSAQQPAGVSASGSADARPEAQQPVTGQASAQAQTPAQPEASARGSAQTQTYSQPADPAGSASIEARGQASGTMPDQPVGTSGAVQQQQTGGANQTYARSELPRTASPLGLTALFGLLSLAGAGTVRLFRQ